MAVHEGDQGLEGGDVEAGVDAGDVVDALTALVDRSLVVAVRGPAGGARAGRPSWRWRTERLAPRSPTCVSTPKGSSSSHHPRSRAANAARTSSSPSPSPDELSAASVVTTGYGPGDRALATLGVVGPTRMDYPGTIASVGAVARYVSHILAANS